MPTAVGIYIVRQDQMNTSKRYLFLLIVPFIFAGTILLLPSTPVKSAGDFYSLIGWDYALLLLGVASHLAIANGERTIGKRGLTITFIAIPSVLIVCWLLGWFGTLDWMFPGCLASRPSILGPSIISVPFSLAIILTTNRPNQSLEPTASGRGSP